MAKNEQKPVDAETEREQLLNDSARGAEQAELEGKVFEAVNNLIQHMGCAGLYLPGRINPHLGVYVGEAKQVIALANGAMQTRRT